MNTDSFKKKPRGWQATDIGFIPKDWGCNILKNVTIETFTRNPSLVHPEKYIKYVDVSSVSNDNYKIFSDQFVKGSEAPGRARKVIQTNDTIFATIRPTLKRIAKVNSNYNDEYCSTAFCVLRPSQDSIIGDFLYYSVLTDFFIDEIGKHQSGASYPAVRDDNVKDMLIPLPNIPEQKKIAHILSKIQQAIETQEQIIKTTQELKKALMHKLFTEGLNGESQKQTEIGPIPESWEVVELGSLFKLSSGKGRPEDISELPDGKKNVPIYGGNGILGYTEFKMFDKPVLVIGRVGEYCGVTYVTDGISWISDNALYAKSIILFFPV